MLDCKELIEQLKEWNDGKDCIVCRATTAIETLLAERDAAVEDLHGVCRACVYSRCFDGEQPCSECTYGTGIMWDADNWKWRGPQKEDKHEAD